MECQSPEFHIFLTGNNLCVCGKEHLVNLDILYDKKYLEKLEHVIRVVTEEHCNGDHPITGEHNFKDIKGCKVCQTLDELYRGYKRRI